MGKPPRWIGPRPRSTPRFWIMLALAIVVAWRIWSLGEVQPPPPLAPGAQTFVRRAVDGDTLLLEDGRRVRLLGVDTPETKREGTPVEPWGPEAHDFTARLVEGRLVRLEFDRERHDKYDRILAYVYTDDKLLNEELLRAGLGRALLKFPYSDAMKRRFRKAEQEARAARRGIWNER
ncbi:MAG TPA: thermonuclease family protein [Planctomycetaceae bacterium]|nr:thermonuclease family protein [Planctomycetaceae bacterium]